MTLAVVLLEEGRTVETGTHIKYDTFFRPVNSPAHLFQGDSKVTARPETILDHPSCLNASMGYQPRRHARPFVQLDWNASIGHPSAVPLTTCGHDGGRAPHRLLNRPVPEWSVRIGGK